jgi:hypothetical protein
MLIAILITAESWRDKSFAQKSSQVCDRANVTDSIFTILFISVKVRCSQLFGNPSRTGSVWAALKKQTFQDKIDKIFPRALSTAVWEFSPFQAVSKIGKTQ